MEHENPMDVHFNSNDVEVFHTEDKPAETEVKATEDIEAENEIASEPVMDVWAVEEENEVELVGVYPSPRAGAAGVRGQHP